MNSPEKIKTLVLPGVKKGVNGEGVDNRRTIGGKKPDRRSTPNLRLLMAL